MLQDRQQHFVLELCAQVDLGGQVVATRQRIEQGADFGMRRAGFEEALAGRGLCRHARQTQWRLGKLQVEPVNTVVQGICGEHEIGQKMGNQVFGDVDLEGQQAVHRGGLEDHQLLEFLRRRGHPQRAAKRDRLGRHTGGLGLLHDLADTSPEIGRRRPVVELLPFLDGAVGGQQAGIQRRLQRFHRLGGLARLAHAGHAALVGSGQQRPETVIDRPKALFIGFVQARRVQVFAGEAAQ